MAKKLYDYDYVLNLEYKVKLLQEIADSQKKNIKLLDGGSIFLALCFLDRTLANLRGVLLDGR